MASAIGSIIERSVRRNGETIHLHSYPAHERTQSHWEHCNILCCMTRGTNGVKDGWRQDYAPMPNNHFLTEKHENPLQGIPAWFNPLVTVSHTKFGQWHTSNFLANAIGLSHIHYEHTWPRHEWQQDTLDQIKSMKSDLTVFISEQSREAWGYKNEPDTIVIPHGVDDSLFKPNWNSKKTQVMACNNDWIGRGSILGFDIFKETVLDKNLPNLIVGDTPGLSKAALHVYDLVDKYNQCTVFMNCARESPLPTVLIEAMSCGLAPVSLDVCMCSELIENGVNGFKSNDKKELYEYLKYLLAKPDECRRMGEVARRTIQERFSLKKFIENWSTVFEDMAKRNK